MASSGEAEQKTFCQKAANEFKSFREFLWNSETREVMGRNGRSWAKIGFFYLIFYGFLAGFFSAMLAVFLTTVEKPEEGGKPKLTQFIENQPGLTKVASLGTYNSTKDSFDYVNNLIKIFKEFENGTLYKGACPEQKSDNVQKPCYAPFSLYGPCQPNSSNISLSMFGLKDEKPCIFIKVNKVYGWMPNLDGNYMVLECRGKGYLKHYPEGFLLNGFPFMGGKVQQLPYVAVQLDATEKDIEVKCNLKGDGIKVSDSYNPTRSFGKIVIEGVKIEK